MGLILIIRFSAKVAHEIREWLDLVTLVDGGRVVSKKSIRKSQKHLTGGYTMSRWVLLHVHGGKEQETNALFRKFEPLNLGEMFLLHFIFIIIWSSTADSLANISLQSRLMKCFLFMMSVDVIKFWNGVPLDQVFFEEEILILRDKMLLKQFHLPIYMAVKQIGLDMWGTLPRVTLVLLSHVKRLNRL